MTATRARFLRVADAYRYGRVLSPEERALVASFLAGRYEQAMLDLPPLGDHDHHPETATS